MFFDLVERHEGMPMQVTTDCGSETTILFGIVNTLRMLFHPEYDPVEIPPHIYLRSVHNVPVERSWYRLRLNFGDTAANDWHNKNDPDQYELCQFLWSRILQAVLDDALAFRNGLKIRLQRDKAGPSGMSREVVFTLPEKWGGRNCLLPIFVDQVRKMKADLGGTLLLEFTSVEFARRAQVVLDSLQPIKLSLENGCTALNSSVTIGVVINLKQVFLPCSLKLTPSIFSECFGNALEWYTTLRNRVATEIDKLMDAARHILRGEELDNDPEPPVSDASTSQPSAAASGEPVGATPGPNARATRHATGEKRRRPHASDDNDSDDESPPDAPNPFPEPPPRTRPSDYLLSRCPACFGGLEHDPSQKVDIDVCLDACFNLKRRRKKGGQDPPRTHPGTHFVPEETAEKMDEHVDGVRPAKNSQAKQARVEDEADGFEGDMKVPRSVLDECESSFKAADEKREKASTQFFDDTGIMALLCRHDRVLWLVNMRTPGEKQYYALALLETLFQHLPSNIQVGVLYDIACQLHRSCTKFGFLGRYLHRILFAVSVFHAFAHRWACQLIYHPLKCRGFGFMNGEGCERFWHSISKLIPYLRYHHRLHTIDSQVEHADKASLRRLGAWLVRCTVHCEDKLQEATKELAACGVAETVLREEWEKQVKAQTKPAERRSKTRGSAAVEEVILLRKQVDALFQKMTVLHDALADTQSTAHQLGVTDKTALEKLRHSDYYAARMNAKVLKDRVRQRLRERKFELDLIERSFRRTRSENQKNEHAAAAIKRREPTINNNVRDYNKLCAEISTLIQGKRAPAGAVAPTPIPVKGIFQLDVDDAIWQDLGLDDDTTPARWLVDANDRCEEEAPRLQRERRHMQMWFATEWAAVKHAIELSHGAVRYQFELKRKELLQLCVVWRKLLDALPPAGDLPAWGPTKEEIEDCEIEGVTASYEDGEDEDNERSSESDDETSSEDEDEDEDEEDEDLLYVIEAVERVDIHRRRDTEEAEWATNDKDIFM
ncbi:hypothetical protein MSAN_02058400 [Mycena sanguinolenta]|uniref:Uncharacterized protein n=1 Tax=Mycena sanguinolenta TaxID=230812 RepID=A0A8H6XHH8_9AGAR|nr:hypothetical protein MSAN_02058400 [Mycena sanguinolenta]